MHKRVTGWGWGELWVKGSEGARFVAVLEHLADNPPDLEVETPTLRTYWDRWPVMLLFVGVGAAADELAALRELNPHAHVYLELLSSRNASTLLTLGEGNLLSHVQLLARNLGVPNVAVMSSILGINPFTTSAVTVSSPYM